MHQTAAMGPVTIKVARLLFDMDGVLVSSIASVRRCWRQWAQHYGVPDAESVEIPHGTRAVDVMRLFKPDVNAVEGLRLIEDLEVADVADIAVLPGAKALLSSVSPDRWTIVTSATHRLAVARLAAAGLPAPDRLITGDMVTRGKPDPEPYHRGAEILGASPAECLVVEDAVSGVHAGIGAGARVLGVLGTYPADALRAAGAAWVVRSLEDVSAETSAGSIQLSLRPVV